MGAMLLEPVQESGVLRGRFGRHEKDHVDAYLEAAGENHSAIDLDLCSHFSRYALILLEYMWGVP